MEKQRKADQNEEGKLYCYHHVMLTESQKQKIREYFEQRGKIQYFDKFMKRQYSRIIYEDETVAKKLLSEEQSIKIEEDLTIDIFDKQV